MRNKQVYTRKEVSFASLDFENWFISSMKKQGLTLHSFCRKNKLNYNTVYSKIKGSISDADVEFFSNALCDYSFIERIIADLESHIMTIDSQLLTIEDKNLKDSYLIKVDSNIIQEGFIKQLKFNNWFTQALKYSQYKNLNNFCFKNCFNYMSYRNKNKANSYQYAEVIQISYILNNSCFLKEEVSLLKERYSQLIEESRDREVIQATTEFGKWFKSVLATNNMTLSKFCRDNELSYSKTYSNIKRNNFKEREIDQLCKLLGDFSYYEMKTVGSY